MTCMILGKSNHIVIVIVIYTIFHPTNMLPIRIIEIITAYPESELSVSAIYAIAIV